jgi:hypothetical protein
MSTKSETNIEKKLSISLGVEVEAEWEIDEHPDLSWIGNYTDQDEEGAIDRQKRGDMKNSSEYRYFVSGNNAVFDKSAWSHVRGKHRQEVIKKYGSLEKATRKYALQDYHRMEAFNNDEWHMRVLTVTVSIGCVRAESSLCGIESDCGEKYEKQVIGEVACEAMVELREKILKRLKVE